MNQQNKKKRLLLIIYTCITFLLFSKISNKTDTNVNKYYYNNEIYYNIDYNNRHILIGSEEVINALSDNNSICIVDCRNDRDPNMSIKNSYKIRNICDIENILRILTEYEKNNPSAWNRTFNSMELEWIIHNICYDLNINRDSTVDVDLNNNDEDNYKLALFK